MTNNMKDIVLIIEDDSNDYRETVRRLGRDKFDFIPNPDDDDEISNMVSTLKTGGIEDYLRTIIQENYTRIKVILCDLEIVPDRGCVVTQGSEIIRFLKNDIVIEENELYPKFVPIIVYTKFTNNPNIERALNYGANVNIVKNDNIYFKTLVEGYANSFKDTFFNSYISIHDIDKKIKIGFDANRVMMIDQNEHIKELIKQNESNFNTLINAVFCNMNSDKKKQFYEKFKDDIEDCFSNEEKQKINQSTWDEIKNAFIDFNADGGGKQLIDTIFEIFDAAGFLGSKGKVIAAGVKGIAGLVSVK